MKIAGNTAGTASITVPASVTDYTLTLPAAANSNAGYQLTCAGTDTITSWAAAASRREYKNIIGLADKWDALRRLVEVPVHRFTYRDGQPGTGDHITEYRGIMADEAPWAMHYGGGVLNPINAFGDSVLAIQALYQKITDQAAELLDLKAELAALKAA